MTTGPVRSHDPAMPDLLSAEETLRARLAAAGRPAVVAACTSLAFAAAALVVVLYAVASPSDGAFVRLAERGGDAPGLEIDVPIGGTDLRSGDVVLAIDGVPMADLVQHPFDASIDASVGDRLVYDILRDGVPQRLEVVVGDRDLAAAVARDWGGSLLVPVLAAMAAFVLWRRPELPAARALAVFGGASLTAWATLNLGPSPLDLAAGRGVFLLGGTAGVVAQTALLHFAVVFPEAPSWHSRRPWAVTLIYGVPIGLHVVLTTVRLGAASPLDDLSVVAGPAVGPALVVAILVVPIVRYRSTTDGQARRQLRIVAIQLLASGVVYLALFGLPEALGQETIVPTSLGGVPFVSFPVVLAIAILRFELFEIRLLIHRSLLYLVLTAGTVGLAIALVAWLDAVTDGRSVAVPAVAAAVVALAVQPLRRASHRIADRVVYGSAAEPYEVLSELGRRLEGGREPTELLEGITETVSRGLGRAAVAIQATDSDGRHETVVGHRVPGRPEAMLSLVHQGTVVGRLVVGLDEDEADLSAGEHRLLANLAAHVAAAVVAARLTIDLRHSRERLVAALEDERRRVGRDLHDGLGPQLAAAAMKLEAAGRLARRDLDGALRLHEEIRAELTGVVGEVRRLVYALRPPALDQLGLVGALEEQGNRLAAGGGGARGPDFTIAAGALPELPAAVEVAAYRIASEAMTNAARHAEASRCDVELHVEDVAYTRGVLTLIVSDDGVGIDGVPTTGVGLASMHERADELGGTCVVEPGERGTTVVAKLPLEPA